MGCLRLLLCVTLFLLLSLPAPADTITWNFGTTSSSLTPSSVAGSGVTASAFSLANFFGTEPGSNPNSTSSSIGYTGASGAFNYTHNVNNTFLSSSQTDFATSAPYYRFTLTPNPGKGPLTLNSISFGVRSTTTGAKSYALRTSLDSFQADFAADSLLNDSTWRLITPSFSPFVLGSSDLPVEFRLYVFNGQSNASTGSTNTRIDDFMVHVTSVPEVFYTLISSFIFLGFIQKSDAVGRLLRLTSRPG